MVGTSADATQDGEIVLGNETSYTQLTAANYKFDINQLTGSGTDGYALVYSSGTDLISLQPITNKYTQDFVQADWSAPVSGVVSLSIPQSTHGLVGSFSTTVEEVVGSFHEQVDMHRVARNSTTGDLILETTLSPSGFNGTVTLIG